MSSWTSKTSLVFRSYISDQRARPSATFVSCAVTRSLSPRESACGWNGVENLHNLGCGLRPIRRSLLETPPHQVGERGRHAVTAPLDRLRLLSGVGCEHRLRGAACKRWRAREHLVGHR